MSNEPEPAEAAAPEAQAPAKRSGSLLLVVAGLVGGVLGGGVGGVVLAPRMVGKTPASAEAAQSGKSGKSEKGEKKGTPAADRVFRIDNVIVNPAGSEGTRFLMTSVAFEVSDEVAESALKAHELELRDLVVGKLLTMTMPMLTAPHARDSLKIALAQAARQFVGPTGDIAVYLPQFVIQ